MRRFDNFAGFLSAVILVENSRPDSRLIFAADSTGAGESIPSRGGFLVPSEFCTDIWHKATSTGRLLPRLFNVTMTKDRSVLPAVDEDDRGDGTRWGGVTLSHIAEADTTAASQPKFRAVELNTKKLYSLIYTTDEMLADMSVFSAWLENALAEETSFELEREVISGAGTNEGLGILSSGALISVAKVGGQTAGTIVTQNIFNMWDRLWSGSRQRSVWLCHPDLEASVMQLATADGLPLWKPGPSEDEPGTLLGRPLWASEATQIVGQAGDLCLFDPSQIVLGSRSQDLDRSGDSVRFLNSETAFRWRTRYDLMPMWKAPVVQRNSSTTVSPYVVVAERI